MKKGKFNIIVGAQAGSEAKGKFAAFIASKFSPEVIAMASSPNAGHTAILRGVKHVTYHLPVSWVASRESIICLGPTSVIRPTILLEEIKNLGIKPGRLFIHPRALVIRDHYLQEERSHGLLKIGSTNQGVGVARREKLMRNDDLTYVTQVEELAPFITDTTRYLNYILGRGYTVLCEMTQGFDLCLEHGIDPHYCTSKIVHPAMAMAEAGVSPNRIGDIYGVLRPYPIRVNNREGSSGPYADAKEITWDEVAKRAGIPNGDKSFGEITTTTKLPRRVFEFSFERMRAFSTLCHPDHLCLQFANYIDHRAFGMKSKSSIPDTVFEWINTHIKRCCDAPVSYLGTGPEHVDMVDLNVDRHARGGY